MFERAKKVVRMKDFSELAEWWFVYFNVKIRSLK